MVSCVGVVKAQPVPHQGAIAVVGDPTPETLPHCDMHLFPKNDNPHPEGIPGQTPFGWLYNYAYPPAYSSWADTPELSPWTPDRRPMMTIQLGSADWAQNSRGNPEFWWITSAYTDDNGHLTIHPDTADGRVPFDPALAGQDKYSPNIPQSMGGPVGGTFDSDKLWVADGGVYRYQPNGVPDQFDGLIRTILRWREFGIRRVMLHLPAGVAGGKYLGIDSGHPTDLRYRKYGGATQSMNQYHGMPVWKRDYFQGGLVQMGNFQPKNAWDEFLTAYCDPSDPDHVDIEVYIGGGIPVNSGDNVNTERTDLNYPSADPNPGYIDRLESYEGLDDDGLEVRKFVWRDWNFTLTPPAPIDPRHSFTFYNAQGQPVNRHGNMSHVYNTISPWFSAGIRRIWFDTASENFSSASATDWGHERRWGAVEFAHNPWIRTNQIKIGGETIPTFDVGPVGNTVEILDDCAVANMPWFATFQVIAYEDDSTTGHRTWKNYAKTHLSPNTEVHILDNTDHMEWVDFEYAREHRYVVGAWNAYGTHNKTAEMMKRWYSLGKIKVADFNGDSVINASDLSMANTAIDEGIAFHANPINNGGEVFPAVFGNGDIDGNGRIEEADRTLFTTYWDAHLAGTDLIRNYNYLDPLINHDY